MSAAKIVANRGNVEALAYDLLDDVQKFQSRRGHKNMAALEALLALSLVRQIIIRSRAPDIITRRFLARTAREQLKTLLEEGAGFDG